MICTHRHYIRFCPPMPLSRRALPIACQQPCQDLLVAQVMRPAVGGKHRLNEFAIGKVE